MGKCLKLSNLKYSLHAVLKTSSQTVYMMADFKSLEERGLAARRPVWLVVRGEVHKTPRTKKLKGLEGKGALLTARLAQQGTFCLPASEQGPGRLQGKQTWGKGEDQGGGSHTAENRAIL